MFYTIKQEGRRSSEQTKEHYKNPFYVMAKHGEYIRCAVSANLPDDPGHFGYHDPLFEFGFQMNFFQKLNN